MLSSCSMAVGRVLCAAGCLLVLSSAATAQSGQSVSSAHGYMLRYRYAAGQSRNYRIDVNVMGTLGTGFGSQTLHQQFDEVFNQSVQAIDSTGNATIGTQIISVDEIENGKAKQYSARQIGAMQPKQPAIVTPTGQIVENAAQQSGGMDSVNSYMNIGQTQVLPPSRVNVKDSWRSTVSAMGMTMFTRSTLSGVTTQSAGRIAEIATKYYGMSGTAGTRLMTGEAKTYLLVTGTGITEFNLTTGTVQAVTVTFNTNATLVAPPPSTANSAAVQGPEKLHLTARMHMDLQ